MNAPLSATPVPPDPLAFIRCGRLVRRTIVAALLPLAAGAAEEKDYGDLSLEELMNETVTSVSKQEQKLFDAPAAVSVLTNEDLRRSGFTTLPDALRLVPGMTVASANSREWALSARGAGFVFANKLLVLIDGRAVYTPLFSGVYWDLQQTMLEDVDRIEVIRGPGATIWGANAVNGVVNVVTRDARDTQGGLLYGGGGDVREEMAGLRYGGRLGENTYFRVFAAYQTTDDYSLADGRPAGDHWLGRHAGLRVDHHADPDTQLTCQADVTEVESLSSDGYNANTLGRWSRRLSGDSSVEAQVYYDRTYRNEITLSEPLTDTFDLSAQHTFARGERHHIIWGGGYRFVANEIKQNNPDVLVRKGDFDLRLLNFFAQDEFTLVPDRLTLTAGLKIEHNDYTGFELQPSLRSVFKPTAGQTVWAAVSRAVRTPSAVEGRDLFTSAIGPPTTGPDGGFYVPALVGNPALRSETLWAFEIGYRVQPTPRSSVDLAVFFNDYDDIISFGETARFVPGTPVGLLEIPWENSLEEQTWGGEVSVTVSPLDRWRLVAGYGLLFQHSTGPASAVRGDQPPTHQATLRSSHDLSKRAGLDLQLRYVDALESVSAYLTADVRLFYRLTDRLEVSLVGQNLLDDRHLEQPVSAFALTSEVPRGFYGKLTWRF